MKLHNHHFIRLMSDDIFLSLVVIRHAAQTIPFLLVSLFFLPSLIIRVVLYSVIDI